MLFVHQVTQSAVYVRVSLMFLYLLLDCRVFLFHVPFLFGSINDQLVQLQEAEQLINQAYQTTW